MKILLVRLICIFWGFASGMIIATGIVAFVTMIGITPRIATKLKITRHPMALGTAAIMGITIGAIISLWEFYIPLPAFIIVYLSFCMGIFIGCLAVALAEVLDVIPIMNRRFKMKKGIYLFLMAFAVGKLIGALYYWLYPGFYVY